MLISFTDTYGSLLRMQDYSAGSQVSYDYSE